MDEKDKEVVAAGAFVTFWAMATGGIGAIIALAAIGLQKACFGDTPEDVADRQEARERRQHEAGLDRAAKRQRQMDRHRDWLAALAASRQADREARRAWWKNGAAEDQRPAEHVIDKDGNRKEATRSGRFRQWWRNRRARTAVFVDDFKTGYANAKPEIDQKRAEGAGFKELAGPAVAGLAHAVKERFARPKAEPQSGEAVEGELVDSAKPDAAPSQQNPATAAEPAPQASSPPATPAGPAPTPPPSSPPASPESDSPKAPSADPAGALLKLDEEIAWYETGGAWAGPVSDSTATDGPRPEAATPEANANAAAPAAGGEAHVEVVAQDLDTVISDLGAIGDHLAAADERRRAMNQRIAAAIERAETQGASDQVKAALSEFAAASQRLVEQLGVGADATVSATDKGGAARRSLDPTLTRLDDERTAGGTGDMVATAS